MEGEAMVSRPSTLGPAGAPGSSGRPSPSRTPGTRILSVLVVLAVIGLVAWLVASRSDGGDPRARSADGSVVEEFEPDDRIEGEPFQARMLSGDRLDSGDLAGCRSRQVWDWAQLISSGFPGADRGSCWSAFPGCGVPGAHADVCDLAMSGSSGFVRAAAQAKDPGAKLDAA